MSNEMKLKVGDVVILKSGSPVMTVDIVCGDLVKTVWFDDNESFVCDHYIHMDALNLVDLDEEDDDDDDPDEEDCPEEKPSKLRNIV